MSLLRSLLMLPLLALAGCATDAPATGSNWMAPATRSSWPPTMKPARGLMFRDQMAADHGMLFIHDREEMQAYWMKNTRIALDILYFDSQRRLVSQQRDVPPCSAGDMPLPQRWPGTLRAGAQRRPGREAAVEGRYGAEIRPGHRKVGAAGLARAVVPAAGKAGQIPFARERNLTPDFSRDTA